MADIVERLRELHAKTTPGGWHTGRSDLTWFNESGVECVAIYHDTTPDGRHLGRDLPLRLVVTEAGDTGIANPRANAAFIVAAHNLLPTLLSEYDRQREEIGRLREILKMAEGHLEEMRKDEKWHPIGDCPILNTVRSALSDATREP